MFGIFRKDKGISKEDVDKKLIEEAWKPRKFLGLVPEYSYRAKVAKDGDGFHLIPIIVGDQTGKTQWFSRNCNLQRELKLKKNDKVLITMRKMKE